MNNESVKNDDDFPPLADPFGEIGGENSPRFSGRRRSKSKSKAQDEEEEEEEGNKNPYSPAQSRAQVSETEIRAELNLKVKVTKSRSQKDGEGGSAERLRLGKDDQHGGRILVRRDSKKESEKTILSLIKDLDSGLDKTLVPPSEKPPKGSNVSKVRTKKKSIKHTGRVLVTRNSVIENDKNILSLIKDLDSGIDQVLVPPTEKPPETPRQRRKVLKKRRERGPGPLDLRQDKKNLHFASCR